MRINSYAGTMLFTSAVLFASPVVAVETLTTEELTEHCEYFADQPESKDGIFCVRYIQGFIDGAVATDERVTRNVAAEIEQEESFSERAMRTRIGSRLDRYGPSYYAEFCLGEPVPLAEVVEKVVSELHDSDLVSAHPNARELVYHTLRTEYPCQEDDS